MRAPSSNRTGAICALAVAATAIGVGTALAHEGGSLQQGAPTPGSSIVNHQGVTDGVWTFTVQSLAGTVKNLAYIVKSPGCPGTTYLEHRIRRPTVGQTLPTTIEGPSGTSADYCSNIVFQGNGSVTVRVTHP